MRILIYLLAMLTGFSAAEAARPASALPAPAGASAGQAYATAAVKVAEKVAISVQLNQHVTFATGIQFPAAVAFSAIEFTTPVMRRDVILG